MQHKSGFVNIIGNPNVGKSTLLNALMGENLSIISSKAQTTRHRIIGLANSDDYQIVFSDTPGMLIPVYKMQEVMLQFAKSALIDADIILFVTDIFETELPPIDVVERLNNSSIPLIVVVNKIDAKDIVMAAARVEAIKESFPKAIFFPVSALYKTNTEPLLASILAVLPENPPYYPKEEITDRPLKFFVSEIIREKILKNYDKEIPYSCEVVIETFIEKPHIDEIRAIIVVERESQKGIVIGHQGGKLKRVGTHAREDIEALTGKKAFLEIHVKVDENWRNDPKKLKKYGYGL
jgi:GTPase